MDDFDAHEQPNVFAACPGYVCPSWACFPREASSWGQIVPEWEMPCLKCWCTCIVLVTEWLNWVLFNVLFGVLSSLCLEGRCLGLGLGLEGWCLVNIPGVHICVYWKQLCEICQCLQLTFTATCSQVLWLNCFLSCWYYLYCLLVARFGCKSNIRYYTVSQ